MSRVIDFLERMGTEAHWRSASQDEIKVALLEAGIEMPIRSAILTKDVSELQALLGQVELIAYQTPTPAPAPQEIPQKPGQPKPEKEDEDEDGDPDEATQSNGICYSSLPSSHSLS